MLILEIALPPYDRQCGWQGVDCAYKSAGICQGLLEKKTMGASCSRYLQGGYAIVSQLSCIFLPMASADGVFRDYASLTEILDLADDLDRIAFLKPYISRRAFSRRQFTELAIEKTTEKARGADSFGKALVELGHRSGYLRNITVRASRRWVLMEAGMILASQTCRPNN